MRKEGTKNNTGNLLTINLDIYRDIVQMLRELHQISLTGRLNDGNDYVFNIFFAVFRSYQQQSMFG